MSALWTELLRWLGAGGMAGVVGYIVSRPKTLGEAKQAAGAGQKSEAEGQVVLSQEQRATQLAVLQQTREAAAAAVEARQLAQKSEEICLHQKREVVLAFDRFINDMERIVEQLPPEVRAEARRAISQARKAI